METAHLCSMILGFQLRWLKRLGAETTAGWLSISWASLQPGGLRIVGILLCPLRAPRTSVSGVVGRNCKVSSDLAPEVLDYHFCYTLLIKHVTKASPDSREGELNYFSMGGIARNLFYHSKLLNYSEMH